MPSTKQYRYECRNQRVAREETRAMPYVDYLNDQPRNPSLYGADEIPRFKQLPIRPSLQDKIDASLARRQGTPVEETRAA